MAGIALVEMAKQVLSLVRRMNGNQVLGPDLLPTDHHGNVHHL